MPVSAATQWEIRQTATAGNVNGGGFVTGASGVDYSQQDAAQYNLTGVTSAGAGNTVLHASAASDMVGNIAHCISGTNFTAGWYEITSVVAGVSITVGTNAAAGSICTGAGANGVINIGGAMSLNSTLDDDLFEAGAPGNTYWQKYSSTAYQLGENIAIALAGTTAAPINWIGYNTSRGDTPSGPNMPFFNLSTRTISLGANWIAKNLSWSSTANSACFTTGLNSKVINCRGYNNGGSSGTALTVGNAVGSLVHRGEYISSRGVALNLSGGGSDGARVTNNFIHDSLVGVRVSAAGITGITIEENIFANNSSKDIDASSASVESPYFSANTFYGSEAKMGTAVDFATGNANAIFVNNNVYGKVNGIVHADTQASGFDDYNNYYNNTNDVSAVGQWQKGANSVAIDPAFTDASQITGTTAITLSSNRIQDSSKDFTALGVVASTPPVSFVNILSGTGVTAQIAGVIAITTVTNPNDTLTLDTTTTANATADKAYSIPVGNNFLPTGAI